MCLRLSAAATESATSKRSCVFVGGLLPPFPSFPQVWDADRVTADERVGFATLSIAPDDAVASAAIDAATPPPGAGAIAAALGAAANDGTVEHAVTLALREDAARPSGAGKRDRARAAAGEPPGLGFVRCVLCVSICNVFAWRVVVSGSRV